jgi:hypothetical protein
MSDHEDAAGPLGQGDELLAFVDIEAERLLDQNVLAGFERAPDE